MGMITACMDAITTIISMPAEMIGTIIGAMSI
jgi:hypothetical protein